MKPIKNTMYVLRLDESKRNQLTKGQLMSKGLFGILEFFQKTNVGAILCTENCPNVRFLEESRRPKSPFEIN